MSPSSDDPEFKVSWSLHPEQVYAAEKLNLAVYALATDAGPLKARLMAAYEAIAPLTAADLPEHLRAEFEGILSELTRNPPRRVRVLRDGRFTYESTGSAGATIPFMRVQRAERLASRMVSLEARLSEWIGAA